MTTMAQTPDTTHAVRAPLWRENIAEALLLPRVIEDEWPRAQDWPTLLRAIYFVALLVIGLAYEWSAHKHLNEGERHARMYLLAFHGRIECVYKLDHLLAHPRAYPKLRTAEDYAKAQRLVRVQLERYSRTMVNEARWLRACQDDSAREFLALAEDAFEWTDAECGDYLQCAERLGV